MGRPETTRLALPIADLTPGSVFPSKEDHHASWLLCQEWDDPIAPRGHFGLPSQKERWQLDGQAAIAFNRGGVRRDEERALVVMESNWERLEVTATFYPRQHLVGVTMDDPRARLSRIGLVACQQTSRSYLFFGVEAGQSLCLSLRNDDEWIVLATQKSDLLDTCVTLKLTIGDGLLRACCSGKDFAHEQPWSSPQGRAGYRSLGCSDLLALECRGKLFKPRPKIVPAKPKWDFAETGRINLRPLSQVSGVVCGGPDGETRLILNTPEGLECRDWQGGLVWKKEGVFEHVRIAKDLASIHTFRGSATGETGVDVRQRKMRVFVAEALETLDAHTGETRVRASLPDDPALAAGQVVRPDASSALWDIGCDFGLRRKRGEIHAVLKRDYWDGWQSFWALDSELQILWERRVRLPYGHHFSVRIEDLDGDGDPEVLAGGTAFRSDGTLWWEHDRGDELLWAYGGGHYDAAWIGHQDGVASTIFLLAGSCGLYVVDPLTGKTLRHFSLGHAQGAIQARLHPSPDEELTVVATRWGNPGILSAFDARGTRRWTIHPDHRGQELWEVVVPDGSSLFWVNTSEAAQGLYDASGRMVSHLPRVRTLWKGQIPRDMNASVLRKSAVSTVDALGVIRNTTLHVFEGHVP